jgi:hypothetical protein
MGFAKKAWNTMTTGWVVEYGTPRDGPRDFFDNRDRRVYTGQGPGLQPLKKEQKYEAIVERDFATQAWNQERERSMSEESNADACLRWSEQMKQKREEESRRQ